MVDADGVGLLLELGSWDAVEEGDEIGVGEGELLHPLSRNSDAIVEVANPVTIPNFLMREIYRASVEVENEWAM